MCTAWTCPPDDFSFGDLPMKFVRMTVSALALAVAAAATPATPALAQEALSIAPLGYKERTLPNGLKLYSARDPSTANVSVQVWYRVGSKDDPEGRSGFAHLFEHLLFKATRNMPSETLDRLTEDVGGYNNAFTADDVTAYHEVVPANHLERILFAEAERMGSLVVDEEIFQSERAVVQEEFRQRILASPYGRLFGLYLPREIYQAQPYRRPGIGSIEDLAAATVEDVKRFHATYYRPDNAYLIVTGNFDQKQLDAWVDRYFGPLGNPAAATPRHAVQEPEQTEAREADYYAPNVPLPAAVIAWDAPPAAHPDRAALQVLAAILAQGESSRLHQALVYEQQIAVQASASADLQEQGGSFVAFAILKPDQTPQAGQTALAAEIAKLRDAAPSAAELAEAKTELIASILRSRETAADRADSLGWSLINTGGPEAADKAVADLQAVTAADVQRVAQRYLAPQRSVAIRYQDERKKPEGAPAEARPAATEAPVKLADLARAGPDVTLAPEEARVPIPAPGPDPKLTVPSFVEKRLANGLRVIVARNTRTPLVSARLSVDAGYADEPAAASGVAALTAALITQGTATRSAPEVAREIERLGAVIAANSGADESLIYANAPKTAFPEAFSLMADLTRNAAFAAEELERQRAQAIEGERLALSQPGPTAQRAAARLVYGDAPYGRPGSGTPESLAAITQADVQAFHRSRWSPKGATLVFSGDIQPKAAFTLAEKAFGDWRAPADAAAPAADPAGTATKPRVVVVDMGKGAGQAAVAAVMRAPPRKNADFTALELANSVLGGGYSARLNREIRIKRGLSYGAGSNLTERSDDNRLLASAQTRNDAAAEVARLMLAEIQRIAAEPAPPEDLEPRSAALVGGFSSALETVDGLGGLVADYASAGLPTSEIGKYPQAVRALTAEQVQAAAARGLDIANVSLVVAGDASQFLDALKQDHPGLEVIPVAALDLGRADLQKP